jgi:hypothetical protein
MNLNKDIIWQIYSFINESSYYKQICTSQVLKQLKQYFLKKNILIQLTNGAQKVCINYEGVPCLGCYHFQMMENTTCIIHFREIPNVWINYSYYSSLTNNNKTWDQYQLEIAYQKKIFADIYNDYIQDSNELYNLPLSEIDNDMECFTGFFNLTNNATW